MKIWKNLKEIGGNSFIESLKGKEDYVEDDDFEENLRVIFFVYTSLIDKTKRNLSSTEEPYHKISNLYNELKTNGYMSHNSFVGRNFHLELNDRDLSNRIFNQKITIKIRNKKNNFSENKDNTSNQTQSINVTGSNNQINQTIQNINSFNEIYNLVDKEEPENREEIKKEIREIEEELKGKKDRGKINKIVKCILDKTNNFSILANLIFNIWKILGNF